MASCRAFASQRSISLRTRSARSGEARGATSHATDQGATKAPSSSIKDKGVSHQNRCVDAQKCGQDLGRCERRTTRYLARRRLQHAARRDPRRLSARPDTPVCQAPCATRSAPPATSTSRACHSSTSAHSTFSRVAGTQSSWPSNSSSLKGTLTRSGFRVPDPGDDDPNGPIRFFLSVCPLVPHLHRRRSTRHTTRNAPPRATKSALGPKVVKDSTDPYQPTSDQPFVTLSPVLVVESQTRGFGSASRADPGALAVGDAAKRVEASIRPFPRDDS